MTASPTPASAELADLLARVAIGDRAAFARLYERTSAQLLGQILRIERNRNAAEDVLQEVFVKVWRSSTAYDVRLSQPGTWLGSIARNAAIDHLRRRQAQPQTVSTVQAHYDDHGLPDDRDLLQDFASQEPGPDLRHEQASDAGALRRCLTLLSNEQSQAVALAFYQGLSYAEVADHLRQPLGTVKSWVRRGLITLKACLERGAVRGLT